MEIFIKGESINLIVVDEHIVSNANYINWFNDERLTEFMQQHYFPNNKTLQEYYYKSSIENNKNKLQLGVTCAKSDKLIGMVSLNSIDWMNKSCEIAGLIGEKDFQTMNYYVEANILLIKHAFLQLNMNRIDGGVLTKSLLRFFVRILGFKEEGIKRSAVYKNGKFNDVYCFGLLREEFDHFELYNV